MKLKPIVFCSVALLAGLLGLQEQAYAKQHKKFKLERTVNVGYPQDKLPTNVLIDGQPNPCYFQEVFFQDIIHHGSAVEPSIAVNPQNSKNIVAIWQQDRMALGAALEAGIAYTFDGGKTWKRTEIPFQICSKGVMQRVTDLWLSFDAHGKLYLLGLGENANPSAQTQNQEAVFISTSNNGGKNWSRPLPVMASNVAYSNEASFAFMDKTSLTTDPNHPENVYAVCSTNIPNNSAFYSPPFFSRTTDGGQTWSSDTVSYEGEIWSSLGSLLYDPFGDLCTQGLSTCDRNFITPLFGVPGDPGIIVTGNVIVVLPKAKSEDKKWISNKAKRLSGDLLDFMLRIYPTTTATADQYVNEYEFGSLTHFFTFNDIAAVRSQDEGANWNVTASIVVPNTDFAGNAGATYIDPAVFTGGYNYDVDSNPTTGNGTMMRTGDSVSSFNVNPSNGFLYCVYQTGQFRSDFLPQIGITTSRDGGYTWSERVRINQTPQNAPNPQAFTPFVAVTKDGYVGIIYSDFRNDQVAVPNTSTQTATDTWLAIYKEVKGPGTTGIGLDFVQEIRLSKHSYIAQNGPTTSSGVMTNGDYSFLVANKDSFYAVFTQSHNGPFTPPTLFFNDPETNEQIFLDNNYRQSPYVSIVEPVKDDSSSSSSSCSSTNKHKRKK